MNLSDIGAKAWRPGEGHRNVRNVWGWGQDRRRRYRPPLDAADSVEELR